MRRPTAVILPALVVVATVVAASSSRQGLPAVAATQRLYLPIAARNATAFRAPLTRWTTFERTRFNDLDVDANGVVFASTDDGVLRWDSVSGEHRWLTEAEGVPAGTIGPLALDRTGGLWLAAKPTETIADADATTGVRRLAPDGTWQAFTTADGLAGNAVYAIAVDPEGRVWVAAWHGVSRRETDGSWTDVRNPNPNLTCNGADCWHTKLAIAFGGGMTWFSRAGGLSRLAPDGRWYEWASDTVHRIAADRQGGGWIADNEGRYVARYGAGDMQGFAMRQRYAYQPADLAFDAADRLWVGGADRAESIGADGRWRVEGGPNGLPTDGLTRLALDPAGRMWAALAGMIVRLDDDGNGPMLRTGLPLAGDDIFATAPAPDGGMWLGVEDNGSPLGGLVRVDRYGRWTSRGLQPGIPDPDGVRRVVVGRDGTLWAADADRLVRRGPDGGETVYESRSFDRRAIFGSLVLDGDGTLWTRIGGDDGATPVDGVIAFDTGGRIQVYPAARDDGGYVDHPLAYDAGRDELWLGGRGLTVVGPDGIWRPAVGPAGEQGEYMNGMVVDRDGGRWFFAGDSLWFLSDQRTWIERTPELRRAFAEAYGGINAVAADPDVGIWLGLSRGLVRLDADGTWARIALPLAGPERAYASQEVLSLAFDDAGRLWVGTRAGVARLE